MQIKIEVYGKGICGERIRIDSENAWNIKR